MLVHSQSRTLLMQAPDPARILALMPAVEVPGNGYNVAIKHTAAATKILRSMGVEAPSPIMSYYDWPKIKGVWQPFDHQKTTAEFLTMHPRCFCLNEMGTGKTASVLWAADFMMKTKQCQRVLICAPLSTLERVWADAVFDTLMHRTVSVVHGSREKRKLALSVHADFYVINHDGISIGEIRELIQGRSDIDLIVVDEGSMFRNSNTDKWRAMERLINKPFERKLWWLTGTPAPNGPDDVWAQCKLVSPLRVPKFFGAFRRQVMFEVSEHIWKPRPNGFVVAYAAMQPAIRFKKEDCLTLPPVVTEQWQCDLSEQQAKYVKDMLTVMKVDHDNGREITAVNAADKVNKLRQIMLGSVKIGENEYTVLDSKPRQKLLREAIEFASAKVLVIVPFKGAINQLKDVVSKYTSVGVLNGDVSQAQRNKIVRDFKTADDPHTLLCHPKVMAHGLNLVEADVLVFYGPIYSNDEFRQVVERFNRPGQTRKMTVIRIGAHPMEWAIYKMVDERDINQTSILELYNAALEMK